MFGSYTARKKLPYYSKRRESGQAPADGNFALLMTAMGAILASGRRKVRFTTKPTRGRAAKKRKDNCGAMT